MKLIHKLRLEEVQLFILKMVNYSLREASKDGKLDGLKERYRENGQLESRLCYKNGKEVHMSYCYK